MRHLVYSVAASLDGFIAGPKGEYDWIVHDPAIDFAAIYRRFDTFLMGRLTYELAQSQKPMLKNMGIKVVVASTTLDPAQHEDVTVLSSGVAEAVAALKAEPGKDIWLFGGGVLFRSLLDAGLVDSVDLTVIPVMLGSGVPLLPEGSRVRLKLNDCKSLPSGVLMVSYSVVRPG
ncbi:MAG: dihydrofolate reductase family protein [Terracidiphilus sp.]